MKNNELKNDIKKNIIMNLSNEVGVEDDSFNNIIDNQINEYLTFINPLKIKDKLDIRKSIYDSLKRYDILMISLLKKL